jgi:hypothetical protein
VANGEPPAGPVDDKADVRNAVDLSGVVWRRVPGAERDAAAVEIGTVDHDGTTYVVWRGTADPDVVQIYTVPEWRRFLAGAKGSTFDDL